MNPQLQVELARLGDLHGRLLRKAAMDPQRARPAPPKAIWVLDTVTLVLERAERPMRARQIHTAAQELAGETILWTSVKAALAAGATGCAPRFQRVRHGVYKSTR